MASNVDVTIMAAQDAIESILAKLERDTDQLVKEIRLIAIDATSMSDSRPQMRMAVQIDMIRLPGHEWRE